MTVSKKKKAKKPAAAKCGGKKHGVDELCTQAAGWGTDHPGTGKCKLHGGSNPIRHGRYSGIERVDLQDAIARFKADPDPLDLLPEVALLRAITEDLCNRWNEIYGPDGALLAWHDSFASAENPNPKPKQLPDFASISTLVDRVGAMVERVQKMKASTTVSLGTLNRVIEQLGYEVFRAAQEVITDGDMCTQLCQAVERRWGTIRLDAGTASDSRPAKGTGK